MKNSLSPKAKIWLKKLTPSPVTLLLLGLIVYVWFRPPAWVSDEQRPVPNVQMMLTDGRVVSMESLRGKVVLVNFWATWCPYCRHEMPDMQAFYRDWHARGFEILAFVDNQLVKQPIGVRLKITHEIFQRVEGTGLGEIRHLAGSTQNPVAQLMVGGNRGTIRRDQRNVIRQRAVVAGQ